MNRLEVFIVRVAPIFVSIYLGLVIFNAWQGVSLYDYNYIAGHSLFIDLILLLLCFNQGRYHCKYLRFLIYNLLFVDLLGFTDAKFNLIKEAETQLLILSATWIITAVITVILAIKHFYKLNKHQWLQTK